VQPPTSRARARLAQIETIKEISRRLIGERGVAGLSLREVAREMGLVSSALYRYFPTRDDLLTALILDAYHDLGGAVERADARHAGEPGAVRWRAVARAIRRWATRHPHEYGLIFGTPVPGYVAPAETIAAASRVTSALGRILSDHFRALGPRPISASQRAALGSYLEVANLEAALPDVPADRYVPALMAWTQIFGCISFELFGHYVGSVRRHARMFERVVDETAAQLGLVPRR
jgi:AcrR family transcriptional regulator